MQIMECDFKMDYYAVVFKNGEIYHHGILGMKWGVRRYQNEDGTLTEAGKKRYYGTRVSYNMDDPDAQRYMRQYGVQNVSDTEDVIKKGATVRRLTNRGEPIDSHRKYVSITERDSRSYEEMFDLLDIDMNKPISLYEYEVTKDIKVANAKKVMEDIVSKYGDTKIQELAKKNILDIGFATHDKNGIKYDESDVVYKGQEAVGKFIRHVMYTKLDEITEDYSARGYDAIIDLADASFMNYPVILLNPKENIKLSDEIRLTHQQFQDTSQQLYQPLL